MRIDIHAPWSVNDHLQKEISEKIINLSKYFGRIDEADIFLKSNKKAVDKNAEVEIRVHIPGSIVFAKSAADSFEKGVAEASEKIRKQLVKKAEISNTKR